MFLYGEVLVPESPRESCWDKPNAIFLSMICQREFREDSPKFEEDIKFP